MVLNIICGLGIFFWGLLEIYEPWEKKNTANGKNRQMQEYLKTAEP